MKTLSLALFGNVRGSLGERPILDLPTKKVEALLLFLATEQETEHRRESLMILLWPNILERSARHNLRQALYHLRQNLPEVARRPVEGAGGSAETTPLLLTNRQTISLHPEADVRVDVAEFESLLAGTQTHDHIDLLSCHHCQSDLDKVVSLYLGDFLDDFYLDDSNEFEEWAQTKREYFRRQALDALEILTAITIRRKEFGRALEYAERQLGIDNLRESAYCQSMEILALSGRRQEALALYENCRRLFAEELGMEPATRTTQIYERIQAGDLSFESTLAQGVRGYELKDEIGHGVYGIIHRAIQPNINREVAIKVIRQRYVNDPEFIRRFEAEAQIIAKLEHPFIVPLYDYWRDPDGAYLVMRFLQGGSLLSALESGPWAPELTAKMLDQVAGALNAAHQQGVIHRDIKPANILLDETGNTYLSDFGIAKRLDGGRQLTAAGGIIGIPDYISPEQILDEEVGPQTDIYSLGAVLYETLTGEKPFPDSSVANLIYKHLNEPMPLVAASRPNLPTQIDGVIQQATAKRPADRYSNALELAQAFRNALNGSEPSLISHPMTLPEVAELYNPYKGLRAFQEADADDFFGRESLIEELITRLGRSRFLAVVGPSGSGKSSAVKAGLVPALRQGAISSSSNQASSEKWFITEMTPGTHPLEELELALWPIAVDPPPSLVDPMKRDTRGLLRTIRRILPDEEGAQLLLVIDQFEELFTLVDDEEQRIFFIESVLAAIRAPRSPLHVVITLRADFYDRPLQYESLGRLVKQNSEVILPLTSEELTWAIREPARRVGVSLEQGLGEAIIADVSDQPGSLPLLQYALTELFERRQTNGQYGLITRASYEEIGGVPGALGRRAEGIYASLDKNGRETVRQIFLRLATLGEGVEDTRRRVHLSELKALHGHKSMEVHRSGDSPTPKRNNQVTNSHSHYDPIIDAFGEARLLTFDHDPITRDPTVEVAHEALLRNWDRLRGWLDESRNDIRMQRSLARASTEWFAAQQESSYLLRGSRLEQFAGWAEISTIALNRNEHDFLHASIVAREARVVEEEARKQRELETAQKLAETEHARAEEQSRAARRLRRRAVYLGVALAAAVILAVAAIVLAQQSRRNAAIAQENADIAATREAEALMESEQRALAQAQAEDQKQLAFSRELAAASLNNLEADPERSILLALEALSVEQSLEAENALHQALQSSRVRQRIDPPGDLRSMNVVYSPDGSRLWTNGAGGGVLYDVASETIVYEIPSEGWIMHAEFSPDGRWLALPEDTREADSPTPGIVTIVEAATGKELLSFVAHDSYAQLVTFSSDGRRMVTTSEGEVRVWDFEALMSEGSGEPLLDLEGHEEEVWIARYSPDDKLLATGGDALTFVWDTETGEELLRLELPAADVLFSPDGSLLLTAYHRNVEGWDIESGQRVFASPAHASGIESMRFSRDWSNVATMGIDGKAKVFDFSNDGLQERMTLSGHSIWVGTGDFSPDGKHLATGSMDGTIRIWDITPNGDEELYVLAEHDDWVRWVVYSQDGKYIATASLDGTAKIWDAESGQSLMTLSGHSAPVIGIAFSPDGRSVATTGEDTDVILWDVGSGQPIRIISGHDTGEVSNLFFGTLMVTFSPDGEKIATAGSDGLVKVFNPKNGEELLAITADPLAGEGATLVAFSPDGKSLATATDSPSVVRVWDADSGQELFHLPTEFGATWGLAFGPAGDRLAVTDSDGMLSMWLLGDGESLSDVTDSDIQLLFETKAHNATASGLSFSPDGTLLSTASPEGTVKLWDAMTGQALLTFEYETGMTNTAFSPDGRYLAASGFNGQVHVSLLDLDELIELGRSRVTRSLTAEECQQYLHLDSCPPETQG